MIGSAKRNSLILLGVVMIITMIIAAGLPQLELQPGMPLPRLENNQVVVAAPKAQSTDTMAFNQFILVLIILLVAGLTLHMFYRLIRGARWKDVTAIIGPLLVISLIVSGFLFLILLLPKSEDSVALQPAVPSPRPPDGAPLGPVPPLLFYLVGFVLLAVGILIGIWMLRLTASRATVIDVVGLEAEKARQDIRTGVGLKGVIIKCYRQMGLALEKEQGIERKEFMTTGEFENLLEAAGVPYEPIHQLTRLFEAVRYGNWQPNPLDEQDAIHCLEAIILFSRKAKEMS